MSKVANLIVGVAGVVVALAACSSGGKTVNDGTLGIGGNMGGGGTTGGGAAGNPNEVVYQVRQQINRKFDIVFVVDTSPGMAPLQAKLAAAVPQLMTTLKSLPGGLPDVHVGVVSSDMGAAQEPSGSVLGCQPGGDQGAFQGGPRGVTCAAALNPGQTFIANIGGMTNYTGDIADMLACMLPLGDGGCSFTHPLASLLRALGADGQPIPTQNTGFLRTDAFLSVIILADEDDCSAPPDSTLFDPTSMLVSDPLGPLTTFRCTEFGLLCGGKPPSRTSAADLTGKCVSAEDGHLLRFADVANQLKSLKADPSNIFVEVIAGPSSPFQVQLGPPGITSDPAQWPSVTSSCMASDGTKGYPSVRFQQWASSFGANGIFDQVCGDSFEPQMSMAADQIASVLEPPCVPATIEASRCKVVDHLISATGQATDTVLRACTPGIMDPGPCWSLEPGGLSCPNGQIFEFQRPTTNTGTTTLTSTATCQK